MSEIRPDPTSKDGKGGRWIAAAAVITALATLLTSCTGVGSWITDTVYKTLSLLQNERDRKSLPQPAEPLGTVNDGRLSPKVMIGGDGPIEPTTRSEGSPRECGNTALMVELKQVEMTGPGRVSYKLQLSNLSNLQMDIFGYTDKSAISVSEGNDATSQWRLAHRPKLKLGVDATGPIDFEFFTAIGGRDAKTATADLAFGVNSKASRYTYVAACTSQPFRLAAKAAEES